MINGLVLKKAIISGSNNINNQKNRINDLNIFPVPDGDTGTNMSMTISAAVKALEGVDTSDVSVVAKTVAQAMLRGARGNSGVITSLLFRGFANGLEGKDGATGVDLVQALGLGVDAAYKSVAKPTEGTILTVARVAYERALEFAECTDDVVEVWQTVCDAAQEALDQTPELLPVLKRAGVVDAGGKGILVIFEGMLSVIRDGIEIPENEEVEEEISDELDEFNSAAAEFDGVINFTYCTEFIVGRNNDNDPQELRPFLESIGDCVVVVDDEEIIKVHVHTDNPGTALQKALEYGQLLTVKVENMKEQHENAKAKAKKEVKEEAPRLQKVEPTEEYGIVPVAAGEGLCSLFQELGALNVVSGGQSMNPSTDDIYDAVMATPGKVVYVFPNNKNIIMAANQVVDMVEDREVVVVPTKTIPQGIVALLSFDPTADKEVNIETMLEAAKNVATGQVTYAARDSEFGSKKIKGGDIIALNNGRLCVTSSSPNKALIKLAKQMINDDMSTLTLIYGEDVDDEEAIEAVEMLHDKFDDDIDITLIQGGQPIYYYILSVE